MEQRDEGYLPPEPSGPEPDVGGGQAHQQPPPQPPQQPPQPQAQQPPPAYTPPYGYPAQPGYPPPAQPGYSPPYGYPAQPGYYYTPPPPQPGNGPAVASLVVSCVSGFLCLTSAGILAPLTLAGGIVGMVLSRNGKRKIEAGETTKHKDLATAGWWVGIATVVLSVISIIAWAALIIVAASTDSSSSDTSTDPFNNSESSSLGLGLAVARIAAAFVS